MKISTSMKDPKSFLQQKQAQVYAQDTADSDPEKGNVHACKHPEEDEDDEDDLHSVSIQEESRTTTAAGEGTSRESEHVVIANSETKTVGYLRLVLLLVLLGVAAMISFAGYWFTYVNQKEEFETQASEACQKVVSTFQQSAKRRLEAMHSLATSIASNAAAQGQTWPNVTVPDFEQRMTDSLDLAAVMSIILLPIVTAENLAGWVEYSHQNQGWLKEGLAYQEESGHNHSDPEWQKNILEAESMIGHIPNDEVYNGVFQMNKHNESYDPETYDKTSIPWWQFAPVIPVSALVNYDTLTHGSRKNQLQAMMQSPTPFISEAFDYSDDSDPATAGKRVVLDLFLKARVEYGGHYENGYQVGPVSDLYFPVFDRNDREKIVAVLTAYLYWQVYFENILPRNTKPVYAVLDSVCGGKNGKPIRSMYTYEIQGEKAYYMGQGDLHATKYDFLEEQTGYYSLLLKDSIAESQEGRCLYNVHVYPSKEMEDAIRTSEPVYFMLVILSVFLVTSIIFLAYDYYVERRQKIVLNKAIRSTKVVQSLFPEAVRERLFEEEEATKKDKKNGRKLAFSNTAGSTDQASSADSSTPSSAGRGPMVADLYENCSVMFADIAGFTQWSSSRSPTEVFTLLEALYGAFDRIARRRRVFKVETIGDCYLCTTGVPRPQRDHALIMSKFAGDCLAKLNELVHSSYLTEALGEGTEVLKLRVGIHSGSVTAGVLRGERARFQIFGDTVNTASRMESCGSPGRIQVSATTADILRKIHNKGQWLVPREGGVDAKGKGIMETFWLEPKMGGSGCSTTSGESTNLDGVSHSCPSTDGDDDEEQVKEVGGSSEDAKVFQV